MQFSFTAAVDYLVMHRNGAPLISPDPAYGGRKENKKARNDRKRPEKEQRVAERRAQVSDHWNAKRGE